MIKKPIVPVDQRHIVAIGGALSSVPSGTTRILQYLLSLSPENHNQSILVLNTATGDNPNSKESFVESWKEVIKYAGSLAFLTLFERTPTDLRSLLLNQEIIFVGGGNTKSMLAVWHAYGIDQLLREAWERGVILAGSSAGGICWFDSCLTDSWADSFTSLPSLGILKGSCCPHYDGEAGRRDTYHAMISSGELPDGYAIDEATAVHFVGEKVREIVTVSPRQNACAYRVTANGGSRHDCCGDCDGEIDQCTYSSIPLVGCRGCDAHFPNGGVLEVALPAISLA